MFHTQAENLWPLSTRGVASEANGDATDDLGGDIGELTIRADQLLDDPGDEDCLSVDDSPTRVKTSKSKQRKTPQSASKKGRKQAYTRTVTSADSEWTTIVDLKKSLKGRDVKPNKQFELGDYAVRTSRILWF